MHAELQAELDAAREMRSALNRLNTSTQPSAAMMRRLLDDALRYAHPEVVKALNAPEGGNQ
jgi:hypothetical protein